MLVEVMVAPSSRFVGHTLKALDFHWHYNATVLAIHRRGQLLREKLRDVTLSVGDILLILTSREEVRSLRDNAQVVVINEREEGSALRRRAPLALAIMIAVIVVSAAELMPIVISALIGSVAMVLTRCLSREDAYSAIDWRVIVLIAGVLPLGLALQSSGAAEFLAANTLGRVGDFGPLAVLAVLYLLALVLSELMSNAAAAVLLVPIAYSTAHDAGLQPDAVPGGGDVCGLDQFFHAGGVSDQYHGLQHRQLSLHRLHEGGHPLEPDFLVDRHRHDSPDLAARPMTSLPAPTARKLGLVIDLDTCVGCHACAVGLQAVERGGIAGPVTDENAYGKEPVGVWFNRVHSYEVECRRDEAPRSRR